MAQHFRFAEAAVVDGDQVEGAEEGVLQVQRVAEEERGVIPTGGPQGIAFSSIILPLRYQRVVVPSQVTV